MTGVYGILHDQLTYSISPEYFTQLKFAQFRYADFGLPPRFFVAEIGFLATWWVGFFAGWFLARLSVPIWPRKIAIQHTLTGLLLVLICAFAAAVLGYFLGLYRTSHGNLSSWDELTASLGVIDIPSFVRVAYIHNASYLGGFLGLAVAIFRLWRNKPQDAAL